jgi:hypothetical protein
MRWAIPPFPHTYSWRGAKLIKRMENFKAKETHYVSTTKPNRLMLFREMIAVYCENHTEHINTLCGHSYLMLKQVVYLVTTVL